VIGLFGGAFNPPHYGHLELARRALDEFDLDKLLVLVSDDPGHKDVECPLEERLALARLAFADLPRTEVIADPYRYTIDRLRAEPVDDGIFLLGADQYRDFPTWKEPEAVLDRVRLGVATRAGVERPPVRPEEDEGRVEFFEIDSPSTSSRDLRERARRGESLQGLVPPDVAREIENRSLYGYTAPATAQES
jgi:nicotinate-nucleotide adenylyltransferase